jgi:hypothetical protein
MNYQKNEVLLVASLVTSCCLTFSACSDPHRASATKAPTPSEAVATTHSQSAIEDACTLLTGEEIASVQGEPVKESKSDRKEANGLTVSQCFFALPSYERSISLVVVQKGSGDGVRSPLQAWKEMFNEKALQQPAPDATKKKMPPMRVADLGDEAFWVGNNTIGVLHVLKADGYFTISVGGREDQAAKIEKTKTLARSILSRL